MTVTRLTRNEMTVLRHAINIEDYQPDADWLPVANGLREQGLLQADPAFPAVTIATDAGIAAYYAELPDA